VEDKIAMVRHGDTLIWFWTMNE